MQFKETMENPKYELIIEAKDMGGLDVGLTGSATATILIDDKNDHAPVFTKKEVNRSAYNAEQLSHDWPDLESETGQ
ncbi:Cadherin-13 [Varanus komodoensis]|nr:Cadherin-13 [Varanus komodoensis]